MSCRRLRKRPMASINVVPYIDVMLVLLIIFMVTAPLLTQGVQVDLPSTEAGEVESDEQEPVVVTVRENGELFINVGDHPDRPQPAEQLMQRVGLLVQRDPGLQVLVRGDQRVDYGTVVAVMALLQRSGVPSVGLVTDPLE